MGGSLGLLASQSSQSVNSIFRERSRFKETEWRVIEDTTDFWPPYAHMCICAPTQTCTHMEELMTSGLYMHTCIYVYLHKHVDTR